MQEERMRIKGLLFILTCHKNPEQYDVFNDDSKLVGYVRLWHGNIRCDYPNICGKKVYQEDVGEAWTCEFETDEQSDTELHSGKVYPLRYTVTPDSIIKFFRKEEKCQY